MKVTISKSRIDGTVTAPSSKSYTIRGLMCAALARGESQLSNPLVSDDTEAAIDVLGKVGVTINKNDNSWFVSGGRLKDPGCELYCSDSAATLRFMTAICSLVPGRCCLKPGPSLSLRPMSSLLGALKQLGVSCHMEDNSVVVDGHSFKGGTAVLPGDISSQFTSALMLAGPLSDKGIYVKLSTLPVSLPYLMMTIDCMSQFGVRVKHNPAFTEFRIPKQSYKPASFTVEGDWSSASYLLALGATCGRVAVSGLNTDSFQSDRMMLNLLKSMGASVSISGDTVTVSQSGLKSLVADFTHCIDLLPTMAVLAATAEGTSVFSGIAKARLKESNRVSSIKDGLKRMGIEVVEEKNKLTIIGGTPKGANIDSYNDHRIAMAFGVAGTITGNTVIENAECVTKTYPRFWQELKSLGGRVRIDD